MGSKRIIHPKWIILQIRQEVSKSVILRSSKLNLCLNQAFIHGSHFVLVSGRNEIQLNNNGMPSRRQIRTHRKSESRNWPDLAGINRNTHTAAYTRRCSRLIRWCVCSGTRCAPTGLEVRSMLLVTHRKRPGSNPVWNSRFPYRYGAGRW